MNMKNSQKGFVVPVILVIIALLVIGGGVYVYQIKKSGIPVIVDTRTQEPNQDKINIKPPIKNAETKQPTVTSIDADWKQFKNDKYHYQINFPTTQKVIGEDNHIRIIYENTSSGNSPFLASVDISLIGILNEPIEQTASRIAPSELFEKTILNGNQAIKINYKNTYGDPAISYRAILVRNKQNLNFLIRIDTNIDSKYVALLEKSIQTFQFVDQQSLITTQELTLSGKVSVRSGNCMPGPGSGGGCGEKPISAGVLIYPLRNQNGSFIGEKNAPLITKTISDKNGNYKLVLPPGTYSVYVDDNGKETCNGGDGYANMCGITLYESNEEQNLVIDHAAY